MRYGLSVDQQNRGAADVTDAGSLRGMCCDPLVKALAGLSVNAVSGFGHHTSRLSPNLSWLS